MQIFPTPKNDYPNPWKSISTHDFPNPPHMYANRDTHLPRPTIRKPSSRSRKRLSGMRPSPLEAHCCQQKRKTISRKRNRRVQDKPSLRKKKGRGGSWQVLPTLYSARCAYIEVFWSRHLAWYWSQDSGNTQSGSWFIRSAYIGTLSPVHPFSVRVSLCSSPPSSPRFCAHVHERARGYIGRLSTLSLYTYLSRSRGNPQGRRLLLKWRLLWYASHLLFSGIFIVSIFFAVRAARPSALISRRVFRVVPDFWGLFFRPFGSGMNAILGGGKMLKVCAWMRLKGIKLLFCSLSRGGIVLVFVRVRGFGVFVGF